MTDKAVETLVVTLTERIEALTGEVRELTRRVEKAESMAGRWTDFCTQVRQDEDLLFAATHPFDQPSPGREEFKRRLREVLGVVEVNRLGLPQRSR